MTFRRGHSFFVFHFFDSPQFIKLPSKYSKKIAITFSEMSL